MEQNQEVLHIFKCSPKSCTRTLAEILKLTNFEVLVIFKFGPKLHTCTLGDIFKLTNFEVCLLSF